MKIGNYEIPLELNISGFLSSSWIYVAIVLLIGIVLIAGVGILLFFRTYNRKVVFFENISGQGYHPVLKTRARVVKVSRVGGEELLRTLIGKIYLTAYGRKMGKNTYWFAKGPDGYYYNIVAGDLDTKMGILDIEPVDRDVRMFHVALDRLAHDEYGKKSKLPMIAVGVGIFIALVILLVGMYVVAGRFVDAAQINSEAVRAISDALKSSACAHPPSGLAPAG